MSELGRVKVTTKLGQLSYIILDMTAIFKLCHSIIITRNGSLGKQLKIINEIIKKT